MSSFNTDDDEDVNNYNRSLLTLSDYSMPESIDDGHPSPCEYTICNRSMHEHLLNGFPKPTRGDTRLLNNDDATYQQRYDGKKWRRICSFPDCCTVLSGTIYYQNWLCQKHYSHKIIHDTSSNLDNSSSDETDEIVLKQRLSKQNVRREVRGDMITLDDGTKEKYDGERWRLVCTTDECKSIAVGYGLCRRHVTAFRKIKQATSLTVDKIEESSLSPSESFSTTLSMSLDNDKPKKGDIQFFRRRWNGRRWYSLCHYTDQNCIRRSRGAKCEFLCDKHFKEHQETQMNVKTRDQQRRFLISQINKQRNEVSNDTIFSSNILTRERSTEEDQKDQLEECVQTYLTAPFISFDYEERNFISEDNNEEFERQTSGLLLLLNNQGIN